VTADLFSAVRDSAVQQSTQTSSGTDKHTRETDYGMKLPNGDSNHSFMATVEDKMAGDFHPTIFLMV
jgi:hypothetical protein